MVGGGGVVLGELEHVAHRAAVLDVGEERRRGPVPLPDDVLARAVGGCVAAPQVLLGVDDESGAFAQGVFEERVARHEGGAVVAAFDDEVDLVDEGFHFGEAGGVVA